LDNRRFFFGFVPFPPLNFFFPSTAGSLSCLTVLWGLNPAVGVRLVISQSCDLLLFLSPLRPPRLPPTHTSPLSGFFSQPAFFWLVFFFLFLYNLVSFFSLKLGFFFFFTRLSLSHFHWLPAFWGFEAAPSPGTPLW